MDKYLHKEMRVGLQLYLCQILYIKLFNLIKNLIGHLKIELKTCIHLIQRIEYGRDSAFIRKHLFIVG